MTAGGIPEGLVTLLLVFVLVVLPVMRIVHRAGCSRWWGGFVPVANVVFFYVLALARRLIEDELEDLRRAASRAMTTP